METTTSSILSEPIEAWLVSAEELNAYFEQKLPDLAGKLNLVETVRVYLSVLFQRNMDGNLPCYLLSNGGFYVASNYELPRPITDDGDEELSADAAGILATLIILGGMAVLHASISPHHKKLCAFAREHCEDEFIYSILEMGFKWVRHVET